MIWLVSLPLWVLFWSSVAPAETNRKQSRLAFMVLCSLALVFVFGLRNRYVGSTDSYVYSLVFDNAKRYTDLHGYLTSIGVFQESFLFSECGFYAFVWLCARIFPEAQWLLLITAAIIVGCTASFISRHSEDPTVSWIVFICLGSMTFAMNGMRQALAMSICLLSYRYVREKKLLRFLLIVLIAILFHKSAIIFLLVYPMRRMKLNWSSFAVLTAGVVLFFVFSDRFAFVYDSLTGKDYASGEAFESGGLVTILIYLIAIVIMILLSKRLKEVEVFVPLTLVILGCVLYFGRFTTTQIYERISFYFAYFLMLVFPIAFNEIEKRYRSVVKLCFYILAIALFVYRIQNGLFADFRLFWQQNIIL